MYCPEPHTWAGIGGSLDGDETPSEGALREIEEEAGFDGDCDLVELFRFKSPGFTYTNFLAIVDDEFDPVLNWENDEGRWFKIDEFPEDLHPGMAICLQDDGTKKIIEKELQAIGKGTLAESALPPTKPGSPDPSLMTFSQYRDLVDPEHRTHSSDSYDVDLEQLNREGSAEYPKIIQRIRKNGLEFVVRMKTNKNRFTKMNDRRQIVRDASGQAMMFTDEEATALGLSLYDYEFAIFNDKNQKVAAIQDEWGAILVRTAKEYRGFGFGPYLTKIMRTIVPAKESGGFTPAGLRNLRKVHRMFVSDALKSGKYRTLIKQREMTVARVKEIVDSATFPETGEYKDVDLSASNPSDWLLYGDDNGTFVLYDRKIKDLFEKEERWSHFLDTMIKGVIYVQPGDMYGIVFNYGGATKEIRSFLLKIAASYCEREGVTLLVDSEDIEDVDTQHMSIDSPTKASGIMRHEVSLIGPPINYVPEMIKEMEFRKTFDQYHEFQYRLVEFAEAKYRYGKKAA
jgi:hypothetical protein